MTTDYFASDLPPEGSISSCNCGPPELDWRPPPDPSLVFADWLEDSEFSELRQNCEIDFPSLIPVDMIPTDLHPLRNYLGLLISAALVLVLLIIGAILCIIFCRK